MHWSIYCPDWNIDSYRNLGRLWLAYAELQGDFCMLFMQFTPSINEKDHDNLWVECALH